MRNFIGKNGFIWFVGVVEDRNDPVQLGRVRVRAFGWHTDDKTKIPTDALPWAIVSNGIDSASVSGYGHSPTGMFEGTWVFGFFLDGERAQEPVVLGTIPSVPVNAPDTEKGFNDPNGIYPKYPAESDVNRLARNGETPHDIIQLKKDGETKEVPCANEAAGPWDEIPYAYAAVYPKNHVYESESGHVKEYDDTEGAERIHEYHRTGTFYEVQPDGTKSTRVVKDNYEIIYGDDYINVKGSVNLTIDTNCTTYIKGNWDIQVDGNVHEVINGTLTQEVIGDVTETYSSNHSTDVTSNRTEGVGGNVNESYGGNQRTNISGNLDVDAARIDLN